MDEDDDTHVNHHLPKAPKVPPSNKRATVSAMSSSANRMLSPVNRQDCGTQRRDVEERTCSTTATPNTGNIFRIKVTYNFGGIYSCLFNILCQVCGHLVIYLKGLGSSDEKFVIGSKANLISDGVLCCKNQR